MSDRIKHLEEKVLHCLEKNPKTRNDDAQLTFNIIATYMPDEMKQVDGKWFISTDALKAVREDNVKRIRAKIQNVKHLFLPTEESVRKLRKISEEEWYNYCTLV